MRPLPTLLAAAALVVASGCDSTSPEDEMVSLIADATARFADVSAATAAGFEAASPCVETADGGMGFHYANFARIDGTIEPTEPELLLYEPVAGGGLRLVGVEFMVAADAWAAAEPPTLGDVEFAAHIAPETRHGIPFPHYDLHVWTVVDNPMGTFAPHNPRVSCAAAS